MSDKVETRQIASGPMHAFNNFGFTGNFISNAPKMKSNFMARINVDNYTDDSTKTQQDYLNNLIFSVKQASKPNITIPVEKLNQYNKKRLFSDKVEFSSSSITFYDTFKTHAGKFLYDYLRYYFYEFSSSKNRSSWYDDVTSSVYNMDGGWGYTPRSDQYFINSIEVYQIYGKRKFDRYIYMNPKINNINFGDNDYSSTSDLAEISVGFDYEGVLIDLDQSWEEPTGTGESHFNLKYRDNRNGTLSSFDPMKFVDYSETPNFVETYEDDRENISNVVSSQWRTFGTTLDTTGIDYSRSGTTETTTEQRATPSFIKNRFNTKKSTSITDSSTVDVSTTTTNGVISKIPSDDIITQSI